MLQRVLGLQIITAEGISRDESLHLIKQMECAELALARFLKREISFSDYCDILKLCGVGIDDYLINLEKNLSTVGINS